MAALWRLDVGEDVGKREKKVVWDRLMIYGIVGGIDFSLDWSFVFEVYVSFWVS